MLIGFSIGNFLSFKDIKTFSLVRSSIKEHRATNTFKVSEDLSLLRSSVIYGANSSGKTNFFKSMAFMQGFVFNSSKDRQVYDKINVDRFRLSTETDNKSSYFEIVFIYNQIKYRYGFEVDTEKVHSEWLYFIPYGKKRELQLFSREKGVFDLSDNFSEGRLLVDEKKIRNNALLLSVSAQFNGEISKGILEWFKNFNIISGLNESSYMGVTIDKLKDNPDKDEMLKLINIADVGIADLTVKAEKLTYDRLPKDMPEEIKQKVLLDIKEIKTLYTKHKKYDSKKNFIDMVLFNIVKESKGTQKFLALSGPVIDTLKRGSVLAIDELDSSLHPTLTRTILKLFHSKETNPNNAQLVFASHDTNLLDRRFFRRDQIWFMEKDDYEATDMYSLIEFTPKVRNDASYEKDYLSGKYGAIPFIGDINYLFDNRGE